jgi:hypothetical protein
VVFSVTLELLRGRGSENGFDNVVVARAAAKVSFETQTDLFLGWVRVLLQQGNRSHNHARCAVAALKAVIFTERFLHRVERAIGSGKALDRRDRGPVGLNGKNRAALYGFAIEMHRASATTRRVTANIRSGESACFADVVNQKSSRLDVVALLLTIYGHRNFHKTPKVSASGPSQTCTSLLAQL